MRCGKCGSCCHIPHIPVRKTEVGKGKVPREMVDPCECGREFIMRRKGHSCVALDAKTRRCTIYQNRPKVCREFEPGSCEPCPLRKNKGPTFGP